MTTDAKQPTVEALIAEARNPHWVYDIDPDIRTILTQLADALESVQQREDQTSQWLRIVREERDAAREQLKQAQAEVERLRESVNTANARAVRWEDKVHQYGRDLEPLRLIARHAGTLSCMRRSMSMSPEAAAIFDHLDAALWAMESTGGGDE